MSVDAAELDDGSDGPAACSPPEAASVLRERPTAWRCISAVQRRLPSVLARRAVSRRPATRHPAPAAPGRRRPAWRVLRSLFQVRDPLYRSIAHYVIETGRPVGVHVLINMLLMQLELAGLVSMDTVPSQSTAPIRTRIEPVGLRGRMTPMANRRLRPSIVPHRARPSAATTSSLVARLLDDGQPPCRAVAASAACAAIVTNTDRGPGLYAERSASACWRIAPCARSHHRDRACPMAKRLQGLGHAQR